MGVSVQDQFRAEAGNDPQQSGSVRQVFAPADDAGNRWMMNRHDTKNTPAGGLFKKCRQPFKLGNTDAADGQMRSTRMCAGHPDQGDSAAYPQRRKQVV